MVEKSHTAGSWPELYEPLRGLGQKVADWFAPRSEASAVADYYEIKVELPGVTAEDIEVLVHVNSRLPATNTKPNVGRGLQLSFQLF